MQTKIAVIGINHKKAPIEIREKFSLSGPEQQLLLSELKNSPEVLEAFVLSTCNRVEIYAHLLNSETNPYILLDLVCRIKKISAPPELYSYFYCHTHENATRHLLKVTSGLDSLVLGEKQILGQVKEAVALAQSQSLFQQYFNILSNTAIRAGKKAQHETDISSGGSSIGWAAVLMAENLSGSWEGKNVLIIGAGKISQLTIQQLSTKPIEKLYLMNRTHEKAAPLAQTYNAEVVSLYDLKEILAVADVVITGVSAPHCIIEKALLERIMAARPHRELVMIDIAVPRNVDPQAREIPGVKLRTVDDLEVVIEQTMAKRVASVKAVEAIVESKLAEFYEKIRKIQNIEEMGRPA